MVERGNQSRTQPTLLTSTPKLKLPNSIIQCGYPYRETLIGSGDFKSAPGVCRCIKALKLAGFKISFFINCQKMAKIRVKDIYCFARNLAETANFAYSNCSFIQFFSLLWKITIQLDKINQDPTLVMCPNGGQS